MMASKSYQWIQKHRKELREKYEGKVVIVCEGKVVKIFDDAVDPITINDVAEQICGDKDWSYTYLGREEEYLL
jgi:hypothetical protein